MKKIIIDCEKYLQHYYRRRYNWPCCNKYKCRCYDRYDPTRRHKKYGKNNNRLRESRSFSNDKCSNCDKNPPIPAQEVKLIYKLCDNGTILFALIIIYILMGLLILRISTNELKKLNI